jgi:hypothetical protein
MSISGSVNPQFDGDDWGSFHDPPMEVPTPPTPTAFLEFHDDSPYPTVLALQDAVNAHAKDHGYALSRAHGNNNKAGEYYKYTFFCDRGGSETESKALLRTTSTKKTGCLYHCVVRHSDEGWRWEQHSKPERRVHNHPPFDPSAHPQHRKIDGDADQIIKDISITYTIDNREINVILHTRIPAPCFTKRDAENHRAKLILQDCTQAYLYGKLLLEMEGAL